ncbi:MAG TPA: DinB family protein [Trueperaceae bacterium]|nr:DinB family protein [Trueperaceae bacterium]
MTTTEQRLTEVTTDLMKLAADASARFDRLSGEQLNWRPAPDRWSVAQCLEHLITIQSLYQPLLRRLAEADYSPTWWERYSPLSRLFGSLTILVVHGQRHFKQAQRVIDAEGFPL